jgi:hypothetical protein
MAARSNSGEGAAALAAAPYPLETLPSVEARVAALESMDLGGLREVWTRVLGPPPKVRSPELLRLNLAWRIQADAWGGLDGETRQRLRRGAVGAGAVADRLEPGACLTKEWRGVRHEVTVTGRAYGYAGKTWKSLSLIARTITGVRCNGPKFFGLRAEGEGRR